MAPKATWGPPPPDLSRRTLPTETLELDRLLVRIHGQPHSPLNFGKARRHRFDDPEGQFGVCYLALSMEGAFAECFLRSPGVTDLATTFLEGRAASKLGVLRPLTLVQAHGPGLVQLGVTSLISSGDYALCQLWSRALHQHPEQFDGILYRADHDNGEFSVALFDRANDAIHVSKTTLLSLSDHEVGRLLTRYKINLV